MSVNKMLGWSHRLPHLSHPWLIAQPTELTGPYISVVGLAKLATRRLWQSLRRVWDDENHEKKHTMAVEDNLQLAKDGHKEECRSQKASDCEAMLAAWLAEAVFPQDAFAEQEEHGL